MLVTRENVENAVIANAPAKYEFPVRAFIEWCDVYLNLTGMTTLIESSNEYFNQFSSLNSDFSFLLYDRELVPLLQYDVRNLIGMSIVDHSPRFLLQLLTYFFGNQVTISYRTVDGGVVESDVDARFTDTNIYTDMGLYTDMLSGLYSLLITLYYQINQVEDFIPKRDVLMQTCVAFKQAWIFYLLQTVYVISINTLDPTDPYHDPSWDEYYELISLDTSLLWETDRGHTTDETPTTYTDAEERALLLTYSILSFTYWGETEVHTVSATFSFERVDSTHIKVVWAYPIERSISWFKLSNAESFILIEANVLQENFIEPVIEDGTVRLQITWVIGG